MFKSKNFICKCSSNEFNTLCLYLRRNVHIFECNCCSQRYEAKNNRVKEVSKKGAYI